MNALIQSIRNLIIGEFFDRCRGSHIGQHTDVLTFTIRDGDTRLQFFNSGWLTTSKTDPNTWKTDVDRPT